MGNLPSYDLRPRANGRTIAVVDLALAQDLGSIVRTFDIDGGQQLVEGRHP
jgi:hypothetical protein